LAARFARHGAGQVSAQLSADLALQVVLNEIVQQACLATGAAGAAIVLASAGEMVCRGSTGSVAPALGVKLDTEGGLSGACIKTRLALRCDDALTDPRADAEASRRLSVRSVLIVPLVGPLVEKVEKDARNELQRSELQRDELIGVFEIFSPRPSAFSERDQRTLEALAQRVLENLKRASEPFALPGNGSGPAVAGSAEPRDRVQAEAGAKPNGLQNNHKDESADSYNATDSYIEEHAQRPPRRADLLSFGLGLVVFACVALMGARAGLRLGWWPALVRHEQQSTAPGRVPANPSQANSTLLVNAAAAQAASVAANGSAGKSAAAAGTPNASRSQPESNAARAADSPVPVGTLLVYENGKEVFRMPPAKTPVGREAGASGGEGQHASSFGPSFGPAVGPSKVIDLSPGAADSSLLHRVEPTYPEQARQQQIQGAVVLDVHIGRDGAVEQIKLVSGDRLLAEAATAAVKEWRFQPRVADGVGVEMQTRITIKFRLPR
jgi:TonB family protein